MRRPSRFLFQTIVHETGCPRQRFSVTEPLQHPHVARPYLSHFPLLIPQQKLAGFTEPGKQSLPDTVPRANRNPLPNRAVPCEPRVVQSGESALFPPADPVWQSVKNALKYRLNRVRPS